eukprot:5596640-Prymnesium_polylepis.1
MTISGTCETRKDFSAVPVRITTCIGGGAAEALGFHAIRASYVERSQRISERTSVTCGGPVQGRESEREAAVGAGC